MPKLIPKYLNSGIINNSRIDYANLMSLIDSTNFTPTVNTPPYVPVTSQMEISSVGDLLKNSGYNILDGPSPNVSELMSAIKSEGLKPIDVKLGGGGGNSSSTGGFNLKNQAMGMAANYLGQAIGLQVGGKYGDEIGQLGSVIGQNLLTNGNLKGLFTGGSGAALGGIGYNVLNKAMGGDKNKDFGSKMLTNLGGMAFAINPVLGAAVTGVMVANNLTGKSTLKYEGNSFQSQEMQADLGGSYGSSMEDLKRARDKAGHYGGIARLTGEYNRARNRVLTGNDTLTAMQLIYDDKLLGKIRGQNMADINSLDYRLNTFGGYDLYGTVIGRKGMKLPTKKNTERILNILKYQSGRKFNEHYNGERCNTDQCAQFSNETLRNLGYDTYGDAWNLQNVNIVFNGYDRTKKPRTYNVLDVVKYNHDASDNVLRNFDSKTLDKNQVYAVNMYYNGSPALKTAYYAGRRGGIVGTHTGYLYNKDNTWYVAHNIHGTIHVDPFFNIQGAKSGAGKYGVTAIYRPTKSGLFGLGILGLFKSGGNIDLFKKGGQMNVIPEGALHARLHHMETDNKITRKGIPVIDKQGEQQAEIERNEIIFSLEVTNKLEELRKDGSEKAALEAGKLLVDEIFHNTDDRTGLIQEVIGTDEAKKGVFKEGGIIAEKPNFAIQAEEPEMDSDEDEPVGIEEVEYYQKGGIIAEEPDGSDDDEVEEFQKNGDENVYYEKSGGIIEQLSKLSPDKLKELENILKYLNHD